MLLSKRLNTSCNSSKGHTVNSGYEPCTSSQSHPLQLHTQQFRPRKTMARATYEEPPVLLGDWREFRAKLVQQSVHSSAGRQYTASVKQATQDSGALWAHATSGVEKGGLLVASSTTPHNMMHNLYWQAVVFVLENGPAGSVGVILNRPSQRLVGRQHTHLNLDDTGSLDLQLAFFGSRIYCGGNQASETLHVLHGHLLPRAEEVVPGVYRGGEAAAAMAVSDEQLPATDFLFFKGALVWGPGELEAEVAANIWYPAASSPSVVLRQTKPQITPLWVQVLRLMGGEFADEAQRVYFGDYHSGGNQ